MSSKSYRVDITPGNNSLCSCERPVIYNMPCAHVISSTASIRISHVDYILEYYTMNNIKMTYLEEFRTILDKEYWPTHDPTTGLYPLSPPNFRRRFDRPKINRYKNTMDEPRAQSSRVCSYCHIVGHNRTTCSTRSAKHL
ncbi:hypothetical protein MA16_Dca028574 [Dendrobium catenatum]|uniref:SWIM-type domain-containing protein n=1 Tax=Dendrobium catenatum TaxID=906689 RepID=A0A2I0VCY9_9ASPA|nr:hypothetical protein MA16_Dca028574 [Dendrobium catenatum]